MKWLIKFIGRFLPQDKSNDCGYSVFKLPHEHPFTRACELHDDAYANAETNNQTLSDVDWELFWRWCLIARAASNSARRCKLASEICSNWPLARRFGPLMWDGKDG